jgi:hypothetical protein
MKFFRITPSALITLVEIAGVAVAVCVGAAMPAFATSTLTPAAAEVKRDIRGFYPEMTWVDFEKQLKAAGVQKYCSDSKQIRYQALKDKKLTCDTGKGLHEDGDRFYFEFYNPPENIKKGTARKLDLLTVQMTDGFLLKSVAIPFSSNIPASEMIALISKQYGIEVFKKNDTLINGASKVGVLDFMEAIAKHGRMIAKWKLSDELTLQLKGLPGYELELSSQRILDLEKAEQEIMKRPWASPPPKF